MTTTGKPPSFNTSPPNVKTVKSKSGNRSCMLIIAVFIAFIAMLTGTYFGLQKLGNKSYDNDPYVQATEFYKQGLKAYGDGKLKDSMALMKRALELQAVPEDSREPGALPVLTNAVTHNAASMLTVMAVKTGDCKAYWKYRRLTQKIAESDWTYVITDKKTSQNDSQEKMLKKTQIVATAADKIVSLEASCPTPDSRVTNKSLLPAENPEKKKKH